MNHIYHSVWNEALGAWVAVSEITSGQSKRSSHRRKLLATSLLVCTTPAWALPTGEQLVAGQATVSTSNPHQMHIDQTSQKAVINWQNFSVQQHDTVNIQQPNANAALLNRVVGQDASQIQGKINANGQVYIVNPNGVVFGKTAQVDVGGLVATTHNIKDADFMNGKNHFIQDGAKGAVENHGRIKTPDGGVVALIGEKVTNTGTINTPKGTTALAAGKTVDLDFQGDGLVEVKVSEAALNAQITNKGAIQADGGRVVLTAKAAGQLIDTVINQEGVIRAQGMVERNGEIILEGGYVAQSGAVDVSGKTGGKITVNARAILDTGTANADGTTGSGGKITMTASDAIVQTAAANTHANGATTGGTVHLEATNSVYSSGKISATGEHGGTVNVVSADRVTLAAAKVDASGSQQGGLIRVGGDFYGAKTKLSNNAKTTTINGATTLKADGGDGKVVVWSDEKTDYYGSISANKKGNIEVSSKGILTYAGFADAGIGGNLLLDPKNIIISSASSVASYALIDPHPAADNSFGSSAALLGTTVGSVFTENGNVAVSSSGDDLAANNAGAVYLFNTTTGALLAALTGSNANDRVGSNGITVLSNGNYVVNSSNWNNGAGAATWGNGNTGVSGIVSVANSFTGANAGDFVSSSGVTALTNGNYVVASNNWSNGAIANTGAVTWGNGATGSNGTVSAANSLVGSTAFDNVGGFGNSVTALSNGNYVVASSNWDNGGIVDAGAATWGNGATGISGTINSFNSLVGSTAFDNVGGNVITALTNGNYVVSSSNWDNGGIVDAGAATWGNGATGINGTISAFNSLVGSTANDFVSGNGITALSNGNYVVASSNWTDASSIPVATVGAVTWGNGATGISGAISVFNSLIGTNFNDNVGSNGVTALSNGNYVVGSGNWDNGGIVDAGAATWGNGAIGRVGVVSAANSLVGSTAFDNVGGFGGITALTNGNYVVTSTNWDNGGIVDAGAATLGNGAIGRIGVISAANSLVGTTVNDNVGSSVTALTNGNYVVTSSNWNNGAITSAGAVTWANGAAGLVGAVSAANSLVGSTVNDFVGNFGRVTALTNGHYVVASSSWDNGIITDTGAATWGNGATGISGTISATNSLIGASAFDAVSSDGITALPNGNYVVLSSGWNNGTVTSAGATTWGNGTTGTSGIVSTINSLTGSATGDFGNRNSEQIFNLAVIGLSNGNYIVPSGIWDNAGLVDAGQVRVVTPQNIFFNNGLGQTMSFNPSTISTTLALGTNITLQASNDLTLDAGTDIIVGGSNGGVLTLQAGRNITLNSSIFTANGNFNAIAGDPNAIAADREAGTPTITLGAGATINAGSGHVILAAIGGNFVNNTGSVTPIIANRWLVYSTDPRLNSLNGMLADAKHYGTDFTGVTPAYAGTGNWFFYSVTPVLTITPNSQIITYGGTPADFGFTITGFIDGDTIDSAGITGLARFGIDNFTGAVGRYNVAYLMGLFSRLGYVFIDNTVSVDELTVIPAIPAIPAPAPASTQPTIDQVLLISQINSLQESILFTPWQNEKSAKEDKEDLLDVKNDGIKLPIVTLDDPFNVGCKNPQADNVQVKQAWTQTIPNSMKAFLNISNLAN
ncbi:MAG: filamentous hemagglutinin N-terminal domain-containing protein [Methylococcales bacterium]|nr:filamentous hemagglutinin N-terminal domain-containing protein [Methylococcales bacterium]